MKRTQIYLVVSDGKIFDATTTRRDARDRKLTGDVIIPVALPKSITRAINQTATN